VQLELSPADIAFRDEVRALIAGAFPQSVTYDGGPADEARWHEAMSARGWEISKWPVA